MKKTIIYFVILIIVIGVGIAVGLNMEDDKKTVQTSSGNTVNKVENKTENKVENNEESRIENAVDNTVENNITNNVNSNITENEPEEEGIADKAGEPKTDLEKAIDIVKEEWGTDSTVKFSFEEKTSNGEYVICVREISTTNALAWYKVNIEDRTCEEW